MARAGDRDDRGGADTEGKGLMSAHRGQHGEALALPRRSASARQHHHQAHARRAGWRRQALRSLRRLRAVGGIVMLITVISGVLGYGDDLKLLISIISAGATVVILKNSHSS